MNNAQSFMLLCRQGKGDYAKRMLLKSTYHLLVNGQGEAAKEILWEINTSELETKDALSVLGAAKLAPSVFDYEKLYSKIIAEIEVSDPDRVHIVKKHYAP